MGRGVTDSLASLQRLNKEAQRHLMEVDVLNPAYREVFEAQQALLSQMREILGLIEELSLEGAPKACLERPKSRSKSGYLLPEASERVFLATLRSVFDKTYDGDGFSLPTVGKVRASLFLTSSCGKAHSFRCGMIAAATFSGTQKTYCKRNVQ